MKAELRVHPRDFMADRHREDWNKTMNALMGEFISDLIKVKGAGEYEVRVWMNHSLTSDYVTIYIDASQRGSTVPYYPYPYDWERAPKWANWRTVDGVGATIWHEAKPTLLADLGAWRSTHRIARANQVAVDIPVGIDWRSLCFERPESAVARLKMGTYIEEEPSPTTNPNQWGLFEGLKRFIP